MMKQFVKWIIRNLAAIMPLGIYQRFFPRDVTAFFYHAVSDKPVVHVTHLYPPVSVQRFEYALLYLNQHFNPVSYEDLHNHILEGEELPPTAVHLSFDDGFGECFRVVRPLLLKHNMPCTFFLTTDWIDNQAMFTRHKVSLCIEAIRGLDKDAKAMVLNSLSNVLDRTLKTSSEFEAWIRSLAYADEAAIDMTSRMLGIDVEAYMQEKQVYLTSEQIQQMAGEGFMFGSHTRSHPKLAQVTAKVMDAEIVESARVVQEMTGADIVPFSFPFSAFGVDRGALADIRERNPFLGLFFDTKGLQADVDFIVNRIWAEKAELSRAGRKTNIPQLLKAAYGELVARR